jgi:hypothetical protein
MSADVKASPAKPEDPSAAVGAAAAQVTAAIDTAIATELAPAVAVALLDKADHDDQKVAPAMACISAGVSLASEDGRVRIQFMFENTTVLPIEMPREAAKALARGLLGELEHQG